MKYNLISFIFLVVLIVFFIVFNSYTKESLYIENFRSRSPWSGFHPPGFRV